VRRRDGSRNRDCDQEGGSMPSEDVIDILGSLVAYDTTSRNSNLDLIDWVVSLLKRQGARIRLTHDDASTKANVLATFGPDDVSGILLSAHTDVVPVDGQVWSSDPFQLVERDNRLYGRGAVDMKGFVACCLAAVPQWAAARLERPIHLALSYDEEVGCFGVPRLIEDLVTNCPKPKIAIVGEPTNMTIGDCHRGYAGFRTTFRGRAAHSGKPSKGVNAIYAAARFIRRLEAMQSETDGEQLTTFNIGQISGGTNINIVPSHCDVSWEVRPAADAPASFLNSVAEQLLADEVTPSELSSVTQEIIAIPALRPLEDGQAVSIAKWLGAEPTASPLSFGTEAGFFQRAGIPAVVCGPGSIEQAHQPDEWISIDQLKQASGFLDRVVEWAAIGHEEGNLR
jgi:acetylornithine deacetylase